MFCPLFITVSRYYDMYTQGGVTYTPCTNAERRSLSSCVCSVLNAHEPLGGSWLNGTAPVRNLIFCLIVHGYSCYQSENISFLYAYSSVRLTLACLITLSDTIITPLELLVKKFLLTFRYILSMICL